MLQQNHVPWTNAAPEKRVTDLPGSAGRNDGVMQLPRPRRPKIRNPRANAILDWVDTFAYIFWLVFTAVLAVMLLIHGWDLTVRLPAPP